MEAVKEVQSQSNRYCMTSQRHHESVPSSPSPSSSPSLLPSRKGRRRSINSLQSSIHEIENSFTLCQFEKALSLANEMIISCCNSDYSDQIDDSGSIRSTPLHYDIPMQFPIIYHDTQTKNCILDPSLSQQQQLLNLKLKIPLQIQYPISIQERAATIALQSSYELWKQRIKHKNNDNNNHNHNNQQHHQNVMDIELYNHIQPFLQLFCHKDNKEYISFDLLFVWMQFVYTIGLHTISIDMILHILDGIFLSMDDQFTKNDEYEDEDENDKYYNENRIEKCNLIHKFNNEESNNNQDPNNNDNDKSEISLLLYNQCYDSFHFLLLDILPFIQSKDQLDYITNELCILITKRIFAQYQPTQQQQHQHKQYQQRNHYKPLFLTKGKVQEGESSILSTIPISSSVRKVRQTIELILNYTRDEVSLGQDYNGSIKVIPSFVKDCLEDCLDDIHDLEDELQLFMKQKEENQELYDESEKEKLGKEKLDTARIKRSKKKVHFSSIVDKLNNRLQNQKIDDDNENLNEENLHSMYPTLPHLFQEYIVDPLWTSEERWINRSKVVTAGIVTYSILWRKRRNVMNVTKRVGGALISPLQEIASALKNP